MSNVWKVVSVVTLVAVILTAAAVVLVKSPVVSAQPAQGVVQTTTQTGITVNAQGQAEVSPDVAYVNLGVRTTAATAKDAMDENSTTMAAIIAQLTSMGVAKQDIRTGYINLTPQTQPVQPNDNSTPKITGYWADNSINVTVNDLAQVGAILDAGLSAGANTINGISFGLKDDSAAQDAALQDAVKTARAKADLVATGLGLKVTSVQSVQVQSYSMPGPIYADAAMAAGKGGFGASVPVEPGQITVNASVQVTFNF